MNIFLIGIGGALGSITRYLINEIFIKHNLNLASM